MPDAPSGKIKLPLVGEVSKRTGTIAIAGIAGVGGIVYWRYRKNAAASSAAAASTGVTMVTDPAGNQCAQVDPTSGYCPGTPEDQSAQEQALYGSQVYGYGGSGSSGIGYPGNGAGEYTDPNGVVCLNPDADGYCPQTVSGTPTTNQITSNAQWVQEVDKLFPSYTQAVAMVLGGVPVTTAQKNQFLEAVGVFGQPPQGYPSPIQTTDTPGQPTTVPPVSSTVKVPSVTGERANAAITKLTAAGLKSRTSPSRNPAKTYTVTSQNPSAGATVSKGSTVTLNVKEG